MGATDRRLGWAWFFASIGGAALIAIIAAPELPVWSLDVLFLIVAICLTIAVIKFGWFGAPNVPGKIVRSLFILSVIWGTVFWFRWKLLTPHIVDALPGFAGHLVIKLVDEATLERQYVFDVGDPEGARASFYLSPNNLFTFAVTDTRSNVYPLETDIGRRGIPLGRFNYVLCEIGVSGPETTMAVLVNGREVAFRSIRTAIDLGSRKWNSGSLGSNQQGKQFGSFTLAELLFYSATPTDDEQHQMNAYLKGRYALNIREP